MDTIIPSFPRTQHLPKDPCATRDDLIFTKTEVVDALAQCDHILVEEKLDGANCSLSIDDDGVLVVRNRNNIMRPGQSGSGMTVKQFAPLWGMAYFFQEKLQQLAQILEIEKCALYGEWVWAKHHLGYDGLENRHLFFFDLWDYDRQEFMDPLKWRPWANAFGLDTTPVLAMILPDNVTDQTPSDLADMRVGKSLFRSDKAEGPEGMAGDREGIYVKGVTGSAVTFRAKAVRSEFASSIEQHWALE